MAADAVRRRADCMALTVRRAEENKKALFLLVDNEGAPLKLLQRRARGLSSQELAFREGIDVRGHAAPPGVARTGMQSTDSTYEIRARKLQSTGRKKILYSFSGPGK